MWSLKRIQLIEVKSRTLVTTGGDGKGKEETLANRSRLPRRNTGWREGVVALGKKWLREVWSRAGSEACLHYFTLQLALLCEGSGHSCPPLGKEKKMNGSASPPFPLCLALWDKPSLHLPRMQDGWTEVPSWRRRAGELGNTKPSCLCTAAWEPRLILWPLG